jgi:DNA polymerase I-like protein with 3'-5' exonuclease and polymerase domains
VSATELRDAMREAVALGAEFRIVGASVDITGLDELPEIIDRHRMDGLLYSYLGADDTDSEAIDFARRIGVEAILVETRAAAITAVKEMTALSAPHVGFDIETAPLPQHAKPRPPIGINTDGGLSGVARKKHSDNAGLDPHTARIASLQLYAGGSKAFVFRGMALDLMLQSRWLREQHLVAHSAGFELKFLRHHTTPVEGVRARAVDCTMQAAGLLVGTGFHGEGRSLANASAKLLNLTPPKLLQTSDWGADRLSRGQLAYASSDAVLAWRLWNVAGSKLRSSNRDAAYRLQRDAIPAVADIELKGLGFDRDEHARQVEVWSRELAEARHDFLDKTGKPPPSTDAETRAWVAEVAGDRLAAWPRTDKGQLSISADALKWLVLSDVPAVKMVLRIRARQTLIQSFGPKLAEHISPITGRLHASYNIAATKAGRFSCNNPNLQQLPSISAPEFRRCITAAPGHVLIGCDWSQIEMRALAKIARDPALTAVFAADPPKDIHVETAARISGVAPDAVNGEQRKMAKAINFGTIFGMGAAKLVTYAFAKFDVEMTEAQARAFLDKFFVTYPGVWQRRRQCGWQCNAQEPIFIGCGRVVEPAWEPGGKLEFTQYCNLPIQGVCADAMLRALRLVHARLHGLRAWIVAIVHDEIVVEAVEDDCEKARVILEEGMLEAFRITFPGAPSHGVATAGVGVDWLMAKGG